MSRRMILAWILVVAAGQSALAQAPFPRDLVPTRTALSRLGLERQWMGVVPLTADEQVMSISMAEDLVFAHTNKAHFHVFQAETGQPLWTIKLGIQTARSRPASVNSFAVFVTNQNQLHAIDRKTGRTIWVEQLNGLPSSPTVCDEDRVMVGLESGKIYAYDLKVKKDGKSYLSDRAIPAWNWQTGGKIQTRALPASKLVAFGSDDGKVYVALADERTMLYRVATGGAIGAGLGAFGTRLLLAPSADNILYGIDLLTAKVLWTHPSGAPIQQAPFVAGNDIYVVNTGGVLSSIDPNTGSPRWSSTTHGGQVLALSEKRIYLESADDDLFIVDRETGRIIADPGATLVRAGLNLRSYALGVTNRENDRLYFATHSGMIIALREIGQIKPHSLRDPKALPFGYVPPEGISTTPPAPPVTDSAPAAEDKPDAGEAKPDAADAPK